MKTGKLETTFPVTEIVCGRFSKKDAAKTIGGGCRHLHSTAAGKQDPGVKITENALLTQSIATYSWEPSQAPATHLIVNSADRQNAIQRITLEAGLEKKRFLRERVTSVLEELLSNGFYHAYRSKDGREKYPRRENVSLPIGEVLSVSCQATENGIYLSVADQGGTLDFSEIAQSLWRCYQSPVPIQEKENGAGLGTYVVFDTATHFKVETIRGKRSSIACWIADQRTFDPDYFSFNYFERGY